jgi:hypothetical protein
MNSLLMYRIPMQVHVVLGIGLSNSRDSYFHKVPQHSLHARYGIVGPEIK